MRLGRGGVHVHHCGVIHDVCLEVPGPEPHPDTEPIGPGSWHRHIIQEDIISVRPPHQGAGHASPALCIHLHCILKCDHAKGISGPITGEIPCSQWVVILREDPSPYKVPNRS